MKSVFLAVALLLSASLAIAQDAEPEETPAAAQTAKPKRKPPAVQAAKPVAKPAEKPVQKLQGSLEIVQVLGIKQIDPATYEIDARLKSGEPVNLRMNAFVMQSLGKMLGTFGR